MRQIHLHCAGTTVSIQFPAPLESFITILFPQAQPGKADGNQVLFLVTQNQPGLYEIFESGKSLCRDMTAQWCAVALMNEVVRSVAEHCHQQLAIHAAAVQKNGVGIVLPANSGKGKTSLAAWLVTQGYHYLTDELVMFTPDRVQFEAFYRPLNIKAEGLDALIPLQCEQTKSDNEIITDSVIIWPAERLGERSVNQSDIATGLFIFPEFSKDCSLQIEPLTSAQIGLELMACNVNARNLDDHGFKQTTDIAKKVAGFRLYYGQFEQLENLLPELIELLVSGQVDMRFLSGLLKAGPAQKPVRTESTDQQPAPPATTKGKHKKLCIGMATYDDYDGVYFSSQALRMYHPEVTEDSEILVIDNHPTGACAGDLKSLDTKIKSFRYLPVVEKTGTAIRDKIFENAQADYVLCMDCHVFIEPGAIARLLDYFDAHTDCVDLLQGPMYSDDLINLSTHFQPIWNQGMYGVWAFDERGRQVDAPAFEIPMQGLGLFACRKNSWPGFNKYFRGFGGEEGYIHEKFRQRGGRTLCLPFLRWMHRFARPQGVPYPINWPDRIHNYLIGFTELGLDTAEMIEHFNDHLGEQLTAQVVEEFNRSQPSL